MYNCTVKERTALICIYYAVSTLSVVMSMVATAVMIYYKFYRSFNYRLIFYLLISFLPKALVTITAFTMALILDTASYYETIVLIGNSILWCFVWNIQLWIAFMTAEIFSMVIFSVELRKAEIPLTIACFTLPLVELAAISLAEKADNFFMYNAIVGMVVTGICAIAIAITLIYLAYHGLRRRAIENDDGEQQLLYPNRSQQYRKALKESLPFTIYPAMILLWLLLYYSLEYLYYDKEATTCTLFYTYSMFNATTGSISSIVFFIHVKFLGQRKRNIFRNRAHNKAPGNSTREMNEGQRLTDAGSVTATHVTHFDPLEDSDVEP